VPPSETTSAGGVVVSAQRRIAVVNQVTRSTSLPKGHVKAGETPLDAARREIHEEIGINVGEPVMQFPAYSRLSGHRTGERKLLMMFLFAIEGEPALVPLDESNSDARWVEPAEALEALTYLEDRVFLRSAIRDIAALSAG
jgi:8-oxo-dGTP pyrophosphatase MutT (NUDIX family)